MTNVTPQHFSNTNWRVLPASLLHLGPTTGLDFKLVVIGCKSTPIEIEISPEVTTSDPEGGLILLARCVHPPFFLPQGQAIAQAIPMPQSVPVDGRTPTVYWTEVVVENRPLMEYKLHQGKNNITVKGMVDMGADMTIIPTTEWLSQ